LVSLGCVIPVTDNASNDKQISDKNQSIEYQVVEKKLKPSPVAPSRHMFYQQTSLVQSFPRWEG
jgi:hypothetical protein